MEFNGDFHVMMYLFRCALDGTAPEIAVSDDALKRIYVVSKAHDLAHLIAHALSKTGALKKDETGEPFFKANYLAVYRYERIQHETDVICKVFEREKIPYMPLKGTIIRNFYPEPYLRTSCDIDILVHKKDVDRATKILAEELNYVQGKSEGHDEPFTSPNGVRFEMHTDLIEKGLVKGANEILSSVWKNATEENYRYPFDRDDVFLSRCAHGETHEIRRVRNTSLPRFIRFKTTKLGRKEM